MYPVLPTLILMLAAWAYGVFGVPVPPEARALAKAYPQAVRGLTMAHGQCRMNIAGRDEPFRDGRMLPRDLRLEMPDLASIFAQPYPRGRVSLPVPAGQDPGRVRHYGLLEAAYGGNSIAVQAELVHVIFFGHPVRFNRRNGAAAALQRVARDLARDPVAKVYVEAVQRDNMGSGITTWYWRTIEGTDRLSTHSFGIAIDLNMPGSGRVQYWRDQDPARPVGRAEVPWEVVEIFERHGFIWGGKWDHFDTMHFEYRPELSGTAAVRRPVRDRASVRTP